MHPYTFSISLRAWHPSIDPEIITRAFGMVPARTWRVGDARSTPKGTPLEGHYKETYWYTNLVTNEEGNSTICKLEDKLAILGRDLSRYSKFISELRAGGGHAELFIGLYGNRNFGFELPPQTIGALASIGLSLSFDIYPGPA